jgi:hypothetical protein
VASVVVSYGGGDNSCAMLIGLHEHGERPDAIVFADTGGEKPHTYAHLWEHMQPWCERVGFPPITIVRGEQPQQQKDMTLEGQMLRLASIPSRAFGFGQCSKEWKIVPQERWCEREIGSGYVKLIGFHADETHRAARSLADGYSLRYPLIEWGWGQEECLEAIADAFLPAPGKSACFYCPSSTKPTILALRRKYPELLNRALVMERQWATKDGGGSVQGLGRRFAWGHFLAEHDRQPDLFADIGTPEECGEGCFT